MRILSRVGTHADAILNALLPGHCVLCGLHSGGSSVCAWCEGDLPRMGLACRRCTLPLETDEALCGACQNRPPPWDDAIAALLYRFPADRLVCAFKFNRNMACGKVLEEELLRAVRKRRHALPDAIVPVPLHRWRHFKRRFNQAERLARSLGKALGLPVRTDLLLRSRPTPPQSGLDAAGRRRNLKGAFSLRTPDGGSPLPAHVALVDDVMTTGATLGECARLLKKSGVERVTVWTAATRPANP